MSQNSNIKAQNLVLLPQFQNTLAETQTGSSFIQYNLDVTPESQWFIAHPNPKARNNLPFVQELGEFVALRNYMTTRQGLNSYLMKIVLEGEGLLKYGGKSYTISSGQFFGIDCQKMHYYVTAPSASCWNMVWIHFWGNATENYYKSFMELNNGSPVGTMRYHNAADLIKELIHYYGLSNYNGYSTDIKAASILTTLMTHCMNSVLYEQQHTLSKQPPKFIPDVQNYITEHFNEHITLNSLADIFFVNKFYLQKQFRLYVGVSPNEFQKNIRIEKAKELLRATTMSIQSISNFLGFENASYFIRCFKSLENLTPLQYRKIWGSF